ncbi:Cfr10I/Bse634I family restriction endonuclease [Actinophytocola sp.]|uniref:Cfr10I/Bse634I family restriction endonuclease n=1 Tax=Actinophytocola sp. TaxID=1872138 RepID=UPI003D6BD609
MPFVFSEVATRALDEAERCVEDLRNRPVRGRDTKFRLAQTNMLAYTFAEFVPGFSTSHVFNTQPYGETVDQPLHNADAEGRLFFTADYEIKSSAQAKVGGDIFEIVSSAVMWNIAARWNAYMTGGKWPLRSGYPRPTVIPDPNRQVAVLNLPRGYDWVELLTPPATEKITFLRNELKSSTLKLPTSTPDIAVVAIPENRRDNDLWRTEFQNLSRLNQAEIQHAYRYLEGQIEPGEILLAIACKKSLRSDRLYQPLYEANIMQLLLEGHLGAPRVEFEVHTLSHFGTDALTTYEAASLYSVLVPERVKHRAVRELYVPENAQGLARRLLDFLNERVQLIAPDDVGATAKLDINWPPSS